MSVTGIFSQEEIEVSDELNKLTYNGGSGGDIELFFCPNRSTKAYYSVEVIEGLAIITIGTLDDSTQHEPEIEIFTNSKLDWLSDNGCILRPCDEAETGLGTLWASGPCVGVEAKRFFSSHTGSIKEGRRRIGDC